MKFADPYDLELAKSGPCGLFTMTHEGELQFDLFRTRDWRRRFLTTNVDVRVVWNHCVCIDTKTQWPMYVLMTANELVCTDQLTITKSFETMTHAIEHINELKANLYESSGESPRG